jgi:membrane-associated phospholipid phosphatase
MFFSLPRTELDRIAPPDIRESGLGSSYRSGANGAGIDQNSNGEGLVSRISESPLTLPIVGVLMFLFWSIGYFIIAHTTDPDTAYSLTTSYDDAIPYVPVFVFIYVAMIPMFALPFCLVKDNEFFKVFSLAYVSMTITCWIVFLAYPVSVERMAIPETATAFTAWSLGLVHLLDKPVNCFPSMHCAMALLSALIVYRLNRIHGLLALGATFLIGLSTLLTKQHVIADVIGGFALALAIFYIFFHRKLGKRMARAITVAEERVEAAVVPAYDSFTGRSEDGPDRNAPAA